MANYSMPVTYFWVFGDYHVTDVLNLLFLFLSFQVIFCSFHIAFNGNFLEIRLEVDNFEVIFLDDLDGNVVEENVNQVLYDFDGNFNDCC